MQNQTQQERSKNQKIKATGFQTKKGPLSLIFLVTKQERSKIKSQILGFKTKNRPFSAIPETSTLLTSTKPSSQPLSFFCPQRERERERENHRSEKKKGNRYIHREIRKNHKSKKKKGNRYTHRGKERIIDQKES